MKEFENLLSEAAEDIQEWGAYAPEYFQQKHDLAGCVEKYRKAAIEIKIMVDKENQDAKRYQWIKDNILEAPTQESQAGEFSEHKTMYTLPRLIAWADFCGKISLDEAIDMKMSAPKPEDK